ncbi:MAG: succinylglutamate desuccinylase/aspartoacylase family protein [Candidatus Vogelbacteria bacterium]|nr:succinylglutamate desuccinylase/aspartoacylase family protein [Candidatus Vogelbacteria bacterium]
MKNNIITTIGKGKPHIAIVGCVHGDEIIGQKVINEIKKIKLLRGSISFIIANPAAVAKKKRFIFKDLNRAFPGKEGGRVEEGVAYRLIPALKQFAIVLDIHATNSNFNCLAVVTKLNKQVKQLLAFTPITKMALIRKKVFGGSSLIDHCKLGISLEYGPNKTGRNYKKALADIKVILRNLKMLPGQVEVYKQKELFTVSGTYAVSGQFKQNSELKDFQLIKRGETVGFTGQKPIVSSKSFYPLFLGKGRYPKILSLVASKSYLRL